MIQSIKPIKDNQAIEFIYRHGPVWAAHFLDSAWTALLCEMMIFVSAFFELSAEYERIEHFFVSVEFGKFVDEKKRTKSRGGFP
jgi:hypothetical protein